MSDTSPQIEMLGQPSPPSLSPETIAYEQGLLADPTFCRDHPEHAAMIRSSLEAALQATGYQPPPSDPRTPAQRLHDQQHGVAFGPAGETLLPEHVAISVMRDAAGNPPDASDVARQLGAAGFDYKTTIADAQHAIDRAGATFSAVKVENLSAHALSQLAIYGAHLRRHAASRPR